MLVDDNGRVTHAHIVVAGASGSGKTALIAAFASGTKPSSTAVDQYEQTLQHTVVVRHSIAANGPNSSNTSNTDTRIIASVSEVGGNPANDALLSAALRDADGVMLVFCVCSAASFDRARSLAIALRSRDSGVTQPDSSMHLLLVGSRLDLTKNFQRQVPSETAKLFAASLHIPFCETTARAPQNVTEVFNMLLTNIQQNKAAIARVLANNRASKLSAASTSGNHQLPSTSNQPGLSRRDSIASKSSGLSGSTSSSLPKPNTSKNARSISTVAGGSSTSTSGFMSANSPAEPKTGITARRDLSHASNFSGLSEDAHIMRNVNTFGALDLLKLWRQQQPRSSSDGIVSRNTSTQEIHGDRDNRVPSQRSTHEAAGNMMKIENLEALVSPTLSTGSVTTADRVHSASSLSAFDDLTIKSPVLLPVDQRFNVKRDGNGGSGGPRVPIQKQQSQSRNASVEIDRSGYTLKPPSNSQPQDKTMRRSDSALDHHHQQQQHPSVHHRASLPNLLTGSPVIPFALSSPVTPPLPHQHHFDFPEDDERFFAKRLMQLATAREYSGTQPLKKGSLRQKRDALLFSSSLGQQQQQQQRLQPNAISSPSSSNRSPRSFASSPSTIQQPHQTSSNRPPPIEYMVPAPSVTHRMDAQSVRGDFAQPQNDAFFAQAGSIAGPARASRIRRPSSRQLLDRLDSMMEEIQDFESSVVMTPVVGDFLGHQADAWKASMESDQQHQQHQQQQQQQENKAAAGADLKNVAIMKGILADLDEGSVADLVRRYDVGRV
ncbi:Ras- protein Rab-12 [Chytriomyces hyalinus]|nr:Ras- protein Rab-12 [Chytriomyces hyalinus]